MFDDFPLGCFLHHPDVSQRGTSCGWSFGGFASADEKMTPELLGLLKNF
jgi:hypothetical protein